MARRVATAVLRVAVRVADEGVAEETLAVEAVRAVRVAGPEVRGS